MIKKFNHPTHKSPSSFIKTNTTTISNAKSQKNISQNHEGLANTIAMLTLKIESVQNLLHDEAQKQSGNYAELMREINMLKNKNKQKKNRQNNEPISKRNLSINMQVVKRQHQNSSILKNDSNHNLKEYYSGSPFKNESIMNKLNEMALSQNKKIVLSQNKELVLSQNKQSNQIDIEPERISMQFEVQRSISELTQKVKLNEILIEGLSEKIKIYSEERERSSKGENTIEKEIIFNTQKIEEIEANQQLFYLEFSKIIEEKIRSLEEKYQLQYDKQENTKQLNSFLMEELLKVYEKLRKIQLQLEDKDSQIETSEEIQSLIIIPETQNIKCASDHYQIQNYDQKINDLSERISYFEQAFRNEVEDKLEENEATILDLIELTKCLTEKVNELYGKPQ